jgi:glycosyltransferase involved in cell wall biosynthesis
VVEEPRVLMVMALLDDVGGAQRQAWRLAHALRPLGVQVQFLTGRRDGMPRHELVGGIPVRRVSFADSWHLGDVKFHIMLTGMLRSMLARVGDYDVIHVHQGLWPAYAAVLAARLRGKPCLIKIGNTGRRFDLHMLASSPPLGRLMADYCRRYATAFVATSQRIEDELLEVGVAPRKIVRIPNGVILSPPGPRPDPEARRALGVSPGDCLLLSVGSLAKHKRPLLLLRASAQALSRGRPARLWFVGDGPLRGTLERRIADGGLASQVRCVGQQSDMDVFYRAADAFVSASNAEGMSNALLEAMSYGLPCIATRVSGAEDLIQHNDNGLLAATSDSAALAVAMSDLCQDAALRDRLGTAARRTIEAGYDIRAVAHRYAVLYRQLAAGKRASTMEHLH